MITPVEIDPPASPITSFDGRRAVIVLVAVFLVWAGLMIVLQWLRARAYVYFEFEDEALYLQLLDTVGRSHFENTIHPGHRPSHLMPILMVLWPFYALLGGGAPAVWILKALFIGAGAFPVYGLSRTVGLTPRQALAMGIVYLLMPPTIALTLSTFRPLTLSLGVLLGVLWAHSSQRQGWLMGLTFLLLLFREDLAMTVGVIAALGLVRRYPPRGQIGLGVVAVAWFFIATSALPTWQEAIVGTNLPGGGIGAKLAPIVEPSHVRYYLALLLPLAFLPLLSIESGVAAVGIAAIALNRNLFASHLVHLATPAVAGVLFGAIHALGRMSAPRRRRALQLVGVAVIVAHAQPWIPPTLAMPGIPEADVPPESHLATAWSPFDPRYYDRSELDERRDEALASVPSDASVAVSGHFLPRVSPRPQLYEFGHWASDFGSVDWMVLEGRNLGTGNGSYLAHDTEQIAEARRLLTRWFAVRADADGILVLERIRPGNATLEVRALLYPGGHHRSGRPLGPQQPGQGQPGQGPR